MQTPNEAEALAAMGNGLHAWHKEENATELAAIAALPSVAEMVAGGLPALTNTTTGNSFAIKVAWVHNARAITAAHTLCAGNNQAYGAWVRQCFGPEAKAQWATRIRKTYEQFYGTPLERLSITSLIVLLPQTEEVGIVVEQATAEVLKGNCPTVKWLKDKLEEARLAEIARKAALPEGGTVTASISKLTDIAKGKVERDKNMGPQQPIDNGPRITLAKAGQAPPTQPSGAAQDAATLIEGWHAMDAPLRTARANYQHDPVVDALVTDILLKLMDLKEAIANADAPQLRAVV